MTKARLSLIAAFVALLGGAVWTSTAGAYSCYSYRSGNGVVTNCN